MKTILDLLHQYSPWILGSLIPSIIVGCSKSPKTAGAGSFFKKVLQVLSVVTHDDEAGTFKMPLQTSAHAIKAKTKRKALKAANIAPVALLLLCLMNSTSCSWLHSSSTGSTAANSAISCTTEAIKSGAADLLPTVLAILAGGVTNWEPQLEALKSVGEDALACSLQEAANQLQTASLPPPGETMAAGPETLKKRANAGAGSEKAKKFMAAHKWETK